MGSGEGGARAVQIDNSTFLSFFFEDVTSLSMENSENLSWPVKNITFIHKIFSLLKNKTASLWRKVGNRDFLPKKRLKIALFVTWLGHLRAQSRDLYQELVLVLKYYQKNFGRVPGGARVVLGCSKWASKPYFKIFWKIRLSKPKWVWMTHFWLSNKLESCFESSFVINSKMYYHVTN